MNVTRFAIPNHNTAMQIIHLINDFLFEIFPDIKGADGEKIIEVFKDYYTYKVFQPNVEVKGNTVIVDIDTSAIIDQESDYNRAVNLCEKGRFSEAKPLLAQLIEKNPANSEYHRIMGQVLSEEGDNESAIDCLIDALRWNPKNGWALLMMGNIFAKYKNDVETAMKYYDQALIANPNDNITINNIGANLMQQGKLEEAKKYFFEALKINDKYPNTHYALGLVAEREGDFQSAFYSTTEAIKVNQQKDVLYQNSKRQVFEVAKKIVKQGAGKKILNDYHKKLEYEGDRKIEIIQDDRIPTPAKFEFAENYNREKHVVRYKPNHLAVEHLVMHELVQLDLVI